MNRGSNSRQPNLSRGQSRGAVAASSLPMNMSNVQYPKSKSGLPYVPSTPSTRSSDSGTSYGSRRLSRFDDDDVVMGAEREHYNYEERQRPQQFSRKEGGRPTNDRGRSESPNKRNEQNKFKTNNIKIISVSDHSQKNIGEYQQGQSASVPFYVQSRAHHTTGNPPKIASSNASQSTASTSSSQRQLITNIKSSSSISTFGSTGTNTNHGSQGHQQQPDTVTEEYVDDYNDAEDESSMDDDSIEEETIHTRPMVRYKPATKVQQSRVPVVEADKNVEEEDASPFFNESFDTIDFGSTTGVAPAVPALQMVAPNGLPRTTNSQLQDQRYHQQDGMTYEDEQECYYEDEDHEAYFEDQELLYENGDDKDLQPEYDDDNFNDNGEGYYGDDREVAEDEQLHRAVRRGSALAYTSGGYVPGNRNNHEHDHGPYVADRMQGAQRPMSVQPRSQQQMQAPPPSQPAIPIVRRQQISRSMASKRHLIAASARGVVATRATNNSNATSDVDIPPVSSKQRGINHDVQQQQRQRVIKASSYADIEHPPVQQQQPRRGSVTKATSHNTSLQNPPRSRPQHPTRSSSIRGNSDFLPTTAPQAATLQTSVRRTTSSRRNNVVEEEEEMQRRPQHQRVTVGKAASYSVTMPQNQNAARRIPVNKAASQNGYFEPSTDTPEYLQPQGRGNNGSGRRNKMDSLDVNKSMLAPSSQQRGIPSSTSSRRRSLEHVPSQSFRSNSQEIRHAANQRHYQPSRVIGDCDYDYEDDNNYLRVREGMHENIHLSHRRMSAGYLPPPTASIKRTVSRRGHSMDLTVNDIVRSSNDENDEHLHDVSFSDLAARRF
jgi:hypothetical protein